METTLRAYKEFVLHRCVSLLVQDDVHYDECCATDNESRNNSRVIGSLNSEFFSTNSTRKPHEAHAITSPVSSQLEDKEMVREDLEDLRPNSRRSCSFKE